MSKVCGLIGCFLLGVNTVGLVSYTARVFPNLRPWAFWLAMCAAAVFFTAAILDDYACKFFGISQQAYVAIVVSIALVLVLGGSVQWL